MKKVTLLIFLLQAINVAAQQSYSILPTQVDADRDLEIAEVIQSHAITYGEAYEYFTHTDKLVAFVEVDDVGDVSTRIIFEAPAGKDIVSVQRKYYYGHSYRVLVLLNDGSAYQLDAGVDAKFGQKKLATVPGKKYAVFDEFLGDDMYVNTNDMVYVTRDDGKSWKTDTAGLGQTYNIFDIEMDTLERVWLVGNTGLFMQEKTSDTWEEKPAANSLGARTVHVSRDMRVWLGSYNGLYVSNDNGSQFDPGPAGIEAWQQVTQIGEDIFGNIYVITSTSFVDGGEQVYYSKGGTDDFVRIDQSLSPDLGGFGKDYYTSITGDSLLVLGTAAGAYYSEDQGKNWSKMPPLPENKVSTIAEGKNKTLFAATTTGLYAKNTAGEWVKKFPSGGYMPNVVVFSDKNGDLYTRGEMIDKGAAIVNYIIRKSTDNGDTWQTDTAGMHKTGMSKFYVDKEGIQHAGGDIITPSFERRLKVWKKEPGKSWEYDTLGLPVNMDYTYSLTHIQGDDEGNIFLAIRGLNTGTTTVYKKKSLDKEWQEEASFTGALYYVASRNGKTFMVTESGLRMKSGSSYTPVAPPGGLSSGAVPITATLTPNGDLITYYEGWDGAPIGEGLYVTNDFTNWKPLSNNIDTVLFNDLAWVGDKLYALSAVNGMFEITSGSGVDENPGNGNNSFLTVYPNPFTEMLNIRLSQPINQPSVFSISDVSGRVVFTENIGGGGNNFEIPVPPLSKGIYVYQFITRDRIYTGKLSRQ